MYTLCIHWHCKHVMQYVKRAPVRNATQLYWIANEFIQLLQSIRGINLCAGFSLFSLRRGFLSIFALNIVVAATTTTTAESVLCVLKYAA